MTAIRNFDLPDGISDKITGTTSDSYDDVLSWTCYGLAGKTISIKNTHSSNALKYKILTYIYPGGTSFTEVGETSLSAGSSAKHTIGYPCARVIVQVKSSTAGNAATYQIEYTGNRFAGVPSQLDISLSELRDALRGANTKDFSTLEADAESILGQLDIALSSLRDALRGTGTKDFTTLETDVESILAEFQPVSAIDSIAAGDNTAGLTVTLDKGGRPFVDVYYNVGGAADIYIEVSRDGTTWRPLDSTSPTAAAEDTPQYPWVGHRYIRARVPTTGIDITLEISASR